MSRPLAFALLLVPGACSAQLVRLDALDPTIDRSLPGYEATAPDGGSPLVHRLWHDPNPAALVGRDTASYRLGLTAFATGGDSQRTFESPERSGGIGAAEGIVAFPRAGVFWGRVTFDGLWTADATPALESDPYRTAFVALTDRPADRRRTGPAVEAVYARPLAGWRIGAGLDYRLASTLQPPTVGDGVAEQIPTRLLRFYAATLGVQRTLGPATVGLAAGVRDGQETIDIRQSSGQIGQVTGLRYRAGGLTRSWSDDGSLTRLVTWRGPTGSADATLTLTDHWTASGRFQALRERAEITDDQVRLTLEGRQQRTALAAFGSLNHHGSSLDLGLRGGWRHDDIAARHPLYDLRFLASKIHQSRLEATVGRAFGDRLRLDGALGLSQTRGAWADFTRGIGRETNTLGAVGSLVATRRRPTGAPLTVALDLDRLFLPPDPWASDPQPLAGYRTSAELELPVGRLSGATLSVTGGGAVDQGGLGRRWAAHAGLSLRP